MSNLVENLKSIIEKEFITLYDFVLNFSKYNNDSLENTGIFLCNIGFDRFNTIFGNEKYNIYLYGMESDYRMYSTQYLIDRYDPLPKIMNQIKQGYIDRELTSQIFLRKSELLNTFNLREMMSFLTEDMPKNSTTTEDGEVIILKNQLTQAHSEIDLLKAELEQVQAEKSKVEYVDVKDSRLETLLDEQGEYYAPDLAHAVNLWLSLYGNGKIKDDSHTNLSQVWIKHNTGYDEQ